MATCPACGEHAREGDAYCEACGIPLVSLAPPAEDAKRVAGCTACSGRVGTDGYCTACGIRQPALRDHLEIDYAHLAGGVSDRGKRHHRNEDSMSLGSLSTGERMVVVCDGVSSAPRSDEASQAAADAAIETMKSLLVGERSPRVALVSAAARAQAAVVDLGGAAGLDSPSCTFVAAIMSRSGAHVTVAWLGDSRAYLVDKTTAQQLTQDDSWATEVVVAGQRSLDDAMRDRRAHQITRWLGHDSPTDVPRMVTTEIKSPGFVVVCSDGLWNYLSSETELFDLVASEPGRTPIEVARDLCTFANQSGGHDNITVVVLPVRPPSGAVG